MRCLPISCPPPPTHTHISPFLNHFSSRNLILGNQEVRALSVVRYDPKGHVTSKGLPSHGMAVYYLFSEPVTFNRMYRYIHTYIHTYLYIYTYINTYIHTHTYIHTYIHTYAFQISRTIKSRIVSEISYFIWHWYDVLDEERRRLKILYQHNTENTDTHPHRKNDILLLQ
jgi:hypothetical protein